MKKQSPEIITTYGVETTDMAPAEKEAMMAPDSPQSRAVFIKRLRDARERLLKSPDYAAAAAVLDRKVA